MTDHGVRGADELLERSKAVLAERVADGDPFLPIAELWRDGRLIGFAYCADPGQLVYTLGALVPALWVDHVGLSLDARIKTRIDRDGVERFDDDGAVPRDILIVSVADRDGTRATAAEPYTVADGQVTWQPLVDVDVFTARAPMVDALADALADDDRMRLPDGVNRATADAIVAASMIDVTGGDVIVMVSSAGIDRAKLAEVGLRPTDNVDAVNGWLDRLGRRKAAPWS